MSSIGEPVRRHEVVPLKNDPVPQPHEKPQRAPAAPEKVPEKEPA